MTTTEFEQLQELSTAHPIFKKDWHAYSSLDFADTFLPKVQGYRSKAVYAFDGAQLFEGIKRTLAQVFPLGNTTGLITTVLYTFPEGAEAKTKIESLQVAKHEVAVLLSVAQNENIQLQLKLGSDFKFFYSAFAKENSISMSAAEVQNRIFETNIRDFQSHFEERLTQDKTLQFIFNKIGFTYNRVIQEVQVLLKRYTKNTLIFGKYTPVVFIKRSQRQVFDAIKTMTPGADEIFVWLTSEDYIEYDDFVILQFGTNVGRDFKDRNIDQSIMENWIRAILKDELGGDLFEGNNIPKQVRQALSMSQFRAALFDLIQRDEDSKRLAKINIAAFLGIEVLRYMSGSIQDYTLEENRWLPEYGEEYHPLFGDTSDSVSNAFRCGLYNGMIEQIAGIPEVVAFLWEISTDPVKMDEFMQGISKILFEENILELLLKNALQGYIDADTPEALSYQLGKDILVIVDIILGFLTFIKGAASFANLIKKGVQFLKRFGKEGLEKITLLRKQGKLKEIEEIFERLENVARNLDSIRLSKLDLETWLINLERAGARVRFINESKKMKRYFLVKKVGASFDPFEIPPTIWIRKDATDLELFHESMHFEDFLRRGKTNYIRGEARNNLPFGNRPQIPRRDQLISTYIKEKYVFDKILDEQIAFIEKFGKGRFTEREIEISKLYLDDFITKLKENNIEINQINLKN